MRSYRQSGVIYSGTANRTVAADQGMLIGRIFGITKAAAQNGAAVDLQREGVFVGLPKATGEAWTAGAQLFWDNTNFRFTTSASGNSAVGAAAHVAAASGAAVGNVLLDNVL